MDVLPHIQSLVGAILLTLLVLCANFASCLAALFSDANPSVCGCADVKQADYLGDINAWSSYGNCTAWNEPRSYFDYDTNEEIFYQDYSALFPNAGLEANFW